MAICLLCHTNTIYFLLLLPTIQCFQTRVHKNKCNCVQKASMRPTSCINISVTFISSSHNQPASHLHQLPWDSCRHVASLPIHFPLNCFGHPSGTTYCNSFQREDIFHYHFAWQREKLPRRDFIGSFCCCFPSSISHSNNKPSECTFIWFEEFVGTLRSTWIQQVF